MTTENRGKAMQLFDLVLIANELLPVQLRHTVPTSTYRHLGDLHFLFSICGGGTLPP